MKFTKILLVLGLAALVCSPIILADDDGGSEGSAPAPADDDDSNHDNIPDDGGRNVAENDGNDGDDTSLGADPPGSLLGCESAWAYLTSNAGVDITKNALKRAGLEATLKERNLSGTLLIPSNFAFRNLADILDVPLESITEANQGFLRSLLEYHMLFDVLDPTTLAGLSGEQTFDTLLSLTPEGADANAGKSASQIFVRDPTLTYTNLTIGSNLSPGSDVNTAPNGTFPVDGASSTANIIWGEKGDPYRACVAVLYRVDNILLPPTKLSALGLGTAPSPGNDEGDDDGAADDSD